MKKIFLLSLLLSNLCVYSMYKDSSLLLSKTLVHMLSDVHGLNKGVADINSEWEDIIFPGHAVKTPKIKKFCPMLLGLIRAVHQKCNINKNIGPKDLLPLIKEKIKHLPLILDRANRLDIPLLLKAAIMVAAERLIQEEELKKISNPHFWVHRVCDDIGIKIIRTIMKNYSNVNVYEDLIKNKKTLTGHTFLIRTVCTNGNYLFSGSGDSTIKVWDTKSWQCVKILKGHRDQVRSVCVSADGNYLFSGSGDKTIKIWDTKDWTCVRKLEGHAHMIQSICVSADGKYLFSGSADSTIKVWDTKSWQCVKTLRGHTDGVQLICVSADGKYLFSGSRDNTIRVWDTKDWTCARKLEGHARTIQSICVSADGKYLFSGSWDNTIKVWDTKSWQCVTTLRGHTRWVFSVCVSADGKYLISGSWDKTIRVWDTKSWECVKMLKGHTNSVFSVCVNADGKYLISGSRDKTIKIWDIHNLKAIRKLPYLLFWFAAKKKLLREFLPSGTFDIIPIYNKYMLKRAIEENAVDLVKVLLARKVHPQTKVTHELTAIEYAEKLNRHSVLGLLQKVWKEISKKRKRSYL